MSSRVAVVTGLLAGIVTASLLLWGLVAYAPQISDAFGIGSPVVIGSTPGPSLAAVGSPRPTALPSGSGAGASASEGASAEPSQPDASDAVPSESTSVTPAPSRRSPVPGLFHVGDQAPKLSLPLLGGGSINLASLKGKPVWVNFMGTYCPPCRDEFPVMSGFQARYADSGLVVLAVDVREDVSTVQTFVGETGATFAVALDADGVAQKAWGAAALPVHFWIDATGIVRDGALGGIGPDQMAQSLALILPGVTVTP